MGTPGLTPGRGAGGRGAPGALAPPPSRHSCQGGRAQGTVVSDAGPHLGSEPSSAKGSWDGLTCARRAMSSAARLDLIASSSGEAASCTASCTRSSICFLSGSVVSSNFTENDYNTRRGPP